MDLESYFDFVADDAIRIKGTRVGIETVLWDYGLGATPEEIAIRYPTLSLQQVYVTITYYLVSRPALDAYMERVQRQGEEAWQEQQRHPSDFVQSLRERLERQRQVLRLRSWAHPLVSAGR
jgi:uncharacterized protein (DUF433 family)